MSNESIVAWLLLTLGAVLISYLIIKMVLREKESYRKEAEEFWFEYDHKRK
jgi:hypothetical protein